MRDRVSYTMVFGEQCLGLSGKTDFHRRRSNWRRVSTPIRVDHTYMVSYLLFPLIYLNVLLQLDLDNPLAMLCRVPVAAWNRPRLGRWHPTGGQGFTREKYEPGEKTVVF